MEAPESGILSSVFAALLRPYLRSLDKPSLPKYHGELGLAGLKKNVTVRWDPHGIPHVFAADEPDLFFAQGYLHAQERLWQMEMSRRFLGGRTAEIFGDLKLPWKDLSYQFRGRTSVDLDYFVRLLGIRRSAEASLSLVSEPLRLYLDAYCSGINRYIEQCGNKLPWEFRLLRHRPEPWHPEDPLTIGKGLAFLLSTALYTRLNFIAVAAKLHDQPQKLNELLPAYPEDAPVIARAVWDQVRALWQFSGGILAAAGWHPAGSGSNSWAVAPHRSRSGNPILCNDPHLRMTVPSIWYLMHLRAEDRSSALEPYEVWGASIPGCPLIQLGHNRRISWGITAAVCDDVEIYRERLHPVERDCYLVNDHWQKLQTRTELIGVRRSAPREKIIRSTRHGPVLSDFSDMTAAREVLSVRWTAHEPSEEMRSLYGVNRAANWREFQDSLRHHAAPSLNFVYADGAGNIGYALAGNIPLRKAVPNLLPLPGWDESNDWSGYIPFKDLPGLYNPPEGFVATANHRVSDSSYPFYLSHFFEPPHRIRRIYQRLQECEKFTGESLGEIQLDNLSLHAKELIETLKDDLAQNCKANQMAKAAAHYLLSWDGRCATTSVAAAIFHVFHHRLLVNLLSPSLGEELFSAYVEILNQCIVPTDRILADPHSTWFGQRSRADLIAISLREACAELEAELGVDVTQWHWGRIHKLHLNHALGKVPVLKPLLGIGPLPAAGDGTTINLGFYRHSNPYTQTVGASLRFVVEMGKRPSSSFILPSGQSGHRFSRHYADQTQHWLSGKRIQMFRFDNDTMNQEGGLLLKPV
jgi:penicillin amidase